jgi:hypothetical protein
VPIGGGDCTVTLAIHPGDRDFRVASVVRGGGVVAKFGRFLDGGCVDCDTPCV